MVTNDEIERLLDLSERVRHAPRRAFYEQMDLFPVQPSKNARLIISNYADYFSRSINGYLRKENSYYKGYDQYYEYYKYLLNKSLNECIAYSKSRVIRMDNPCGEIKYAFEWYAKRIGKIICYPAFLSTTKDLHGSAKLYLFIYTSKKSAGKDIEPYLSASKAKSEREVVFKSHTKFRIISVDKSTSRVYLREVTDYRFFDFTTIYSNTFYNDPIISKLLDEKHANNPVLESLSERGII